MAACLINITGTSGTVNIRYTLNGNQYFFYPSVEIGDPIYIDDTATDVYYETVDGNAVASSSCITINELVKTCYLFSYAVDTPCFPNPYGSLNSEFAFDQFIIGTTTYEFVNSININPNTSSGKQLTSEFNNVVSNTIAYISSIQTDIMTSGNIKLSFIITMINNSTDIPELRMNNIIDNSKFYIKGVIHEACTIPAPPPSPPIL